MLLIYAHWSFLNLQEVATIIALKYLLTDLIFMLIEMLFNCCFQRCESASNCNPMKSVFERGRGARTHACLQHMMHWIRGVTPNSNARILLNQSDNIGGWGRLTCIGRPSHFNCSHWSVVEATVWISVGAVLYRYRSTCRSSPLLYNCCRLSYNKGALLAVALLPIHDALWIYN